MVPAAVAGTRSAARRFPDRGASAPLAPLLINTVRISVLEVVVESVVIRGRTLVFLDDIAAVDDKGLTVDVACFG